MTTRRDLIATGLTATALIASRATAGTGRDQDQTFAYRNFIGIHGAGGGGGSVDAPVISYARPWSASTNGFDVTTGNSIATNNLVFHGTSPTNATVALFNNGTSVGPGRTVQADGRGNWSFQIDNLTDAAHAITATATVGGVTSDLSSAFNVTVLADLTNLPVAMGQNITTGNYIRVDNLNFLVQNDPTNPQALLPTDTHTLSFYSRYGDREAGGWNTNHTAIQGGQHPWNELDVFNCTLEINFQAAPAVAGVAGGWYFLEQFATYYPQGHPPDGELCIDQNSNSFYFISTASNGRDNLLLWKGPSPLVNNHWYRIEYESKIDRNAATGFFHLWVDGVQVVNLNNYRYPSTNTGPYYLLLEIYRDDTNGLDQAQRMRNILIRINGSRP
jgi:hypothetical protein